MILYRLFIVDICAISGASELHDMVSFECQIPLLPSQMAWLSISFYEEVNKLLMITEGLKLHVFRHFHCTAYERIHALYAPLSKRLMGFMPKLTMLYPQSNNFTPIFDSFLCLCVCVFFFSFSLSELRPCIHSGPAMVLSLLLSFYAN